MKIFMKIFMMISLVQLSSFANQLLEIYTAQKYKVNHEKLSAEQKSKVKQEYKNLEKLSDKVYGKIKNSEQFKVVSQIASVEIWSQQFMKNHKPNKKELQDLYKKVNPMTSAQYKLRSMSIDKATVAKNVQKQIEAKKVVKEKLTTFIKLAKQHSIDTRTKANGGDLGWIELIKVQSKLKKVLRKSKKGDFFIIKHPKFIQMIFVEDQKGPSKATFEQSKNSLQIIAKKQALAKEIQKLLE